MSTKKIKTLNISFSTYFFHSINQSSFLTNFINGNFSNSAIFEIVLAILEITHRKIVTFSILKNFRYYLIMSQLWRNIESVGILFFDREKDIVIHLEYLKLGQYVFPIALFYFIKCIIMKVFFFLLLLLKLTYLLFIIFVTTHIRRPRNATSKFLCF